MRLRSAACWASTALAIPYLIVFWFLNFRHPNDYIECNFYTRELNGGVQVFHGKSYNIVLCGLRGRIDPDNVHHDEIRLMVFSSNGELLAKRYFDLLLNSPELSYTNEHLIYNDGEGSGYQTKIPMPPDRLERIRARLPRFWP